MASTAPEPTPPEDGGADDRPGGPARPARTGGFGIGTARPPMVLAAASLGFLNALFLLLPAVAYFAATTVVTGGDVALLAVFGVLYLALAVGNVWGGIGALRGTGRRVLEIAAAATAVLGLVALIVVLAAGAGFNIYSLLIAVLGVLTVALLRRPQATQFFAAGRP